MMILKKEFEIVVDMYIYKATRVRDKAMLHTWNLLTEEEKGRAYVDLIELALSILGRNGTPQSSYLVSK